MRRDWRGCRAGAVTRDIQSKHDKIVRAVRCGVYIKGELGGIHSGSHFAGMQGIAPVHVGRRAGAWPRLWFPCVCRPRPLLEEVPGILLQPHLFRERSRIRVEEVVLRPVLGKTDSHGTVLAVRRTERKRGENNHAPESYSPCTLIQ